MTKRIIAFLAALLLLFSLSSAYAISYPQRFGAVNDDAAVLSDATAKDIVALNDKSAANFTVVTRHFLGGADPQEYCDGLFEAWSLGSKDLLLLLVIGEERYAVTMGKGISGEYISAEQLNSILSSKFRQAFLQDRDYDGAVGAFLLASASQIARASGVELNTAGLFGTSQSQNNAASGTSGSTASSGNSWYNFSSWSGDIWSSFFSDDELTHQDTSYDVDYEYEHDSGFSTGKLILILVILFIIIRNRRSKGKSGLGAAGWIAAGAGAKEVMRGVNRNRRPPRR